jgi:peptidoglycan/xylan/chitin deacetylase (PgdA/CDA1 family)
LKRSRNFTTIVPLLFLALLMALLSILSYEHSFLSGLPTKSSDNKRSTDKVVSFIFSDGLKSQFTNAKPILDNYGFKATFDVICNNVDEKDGYMDWKEIKMLYDEGHDIGSHSMSHVRLTDLSKKSLEYEVGKSKKCLDNYGIKPSSFEYPFSTGSDNKTIVDVVAKYYEFATRGNDPLMFLGCDGMKQYGQKDCKTYTDNGTPTYANKYSIRNWSHDFEKKENSYSNLQALERFIEVVNSQSTYNKDGTIDAIPIIMYHGIGDGKRDSDTDLDLFQKEMKYIHDNKFKVITISDLAYNEKHDYLYIKYLESETELPAENVTTPTEVPTINATTNVTTQTEVPTINATTNVTTATEVPTTNATTNVTTQTEVPTINATTNVTTATEVPTTNATTNVTTPTEVPTINATTNVTTATEVPTTNATTNVTTPTEVATINATTNVTGHLVSAERNHTLEIVKKVLGIP